MSSESTDNSSGVEAEVLDTISEVFYGGGCLATPPDRHKAMPSRSGLLRATALLDHVDLTEGNKDFPPVGNQGRQNSCVGWAIAYAIKTYLKQVEKKWGSDVPAHQFSPAFIYNQLNTSPEKYGGSIFLEEAMDLVETMGVCTLKDMPYNSESHTTKPNAVQKEVAKWYKSQAYKWLGNDVTAIKECLSNRIPVLIRLPLWESFRVMNPLEPVYRNQNVATNDGHAVCLVGYYDNYKNSGTGVFKFINSWGKGWWESGYGYVTYDLIEKQTVAVVQAYYMLDKVYVESVSLNYSNMELVIGESQSLISTVSPTNASNKKVNYTTDNSNIVTVDAAGRVSARSLGETTIRVYSNDEDSNATAICRVKVKDASLSLNSSNMELIIGDVQYLTKIVMPENATTKNVTWSSSSPAVATIASTGAVTAVSPGESTITVKCNYTGSNAIATCRVKVKDASLSLNKSNLELYVGTSQSLVKSITPFNFSVQWASSNSSVATVSSTGNVVAVSPGEAIITVKCTYPNSSATATCYVKVKDINDSLFISDTIPNNMTAGKTYRVSITLKNTGITNWVAATLGSTGHYCLGTNVNNNPNGPLFLNGANRVAFTSGTSISPNSITTVTFQMKTPTMTGTYKLNFKMLKEQATWFGDVLERNIVVLEATDQPTFNTYGSIGTFKNNQLRNYSHDVIKKYKFKNRHIELYDFTYSTMRTYTHNQLREGDL